MIKFGGLLLLGSSFLHGHWELLCWKILSVIDAELFLTSYKGHVETVFYEVGSQSLSECLSSIRKYFPFRWKLKHNWSNSAVSAWKNQVNKGPHLKPLEHAAGLVIPLKNQIYCSMQFLQYSLSSDPVFLNFSMKFVLLEFPEATQI